MMKYLLVLIVLVIAYNVWRKGRIDAAVEKRNQPRPGQAPRVTQSMVPCAHCGLMLPQSDALQQGTHFYCSAEHQRQGPA